MRKFFYTCQVALLTLMTMPASAIATAPVILSEAKRMACEQSFAIKQADVQVQLKLAECWQVGLRPNPELAVEVSNLGLSSGCCGFDSNEMSVTLSQLYELGGKRSARQNLAAAEASVALWEREIIKQQLMRTVTEHFVTFCAAREKLHLVQQLRENCHAILQCANVKAQSGKISTLQCRQKELAWHKSCLDEEKASEELASAKRQLELVCGNFFDAANLACGDGDLFKAEEPESLECYKARLCSNTELAKQEALRYLASQNYTLQKANAIPDLEVTAGVCRDNCERDFSFCFGAAIAIPVYNKNQGNICAASWQTWAALYQYEETERQLQASCREVHELWSRRWASCRRLLNEALPAAEAMLASYEQGHKEGKYDWQEVLEAREHLYDVKSQLNEELANLYRHKVHLNYLCGN